MFFLSMISLLTIPYNIVWENTHIEIPLYENVNYYFNLPEAYLESNGKKLNVKPDYEKGVNHTFISVVNSRHVKSFYIDYRVYFEEYNITQDQTITFEIVDNISPTFNYIPTFRSAVNEKLVNVLEGVIYSDNYYDVDQIKLEADTSLINNKKTGIYEIIYKLTDDSLNTTYDRTTYEIYDNIAPVIKEKKALNHEINKLFKWEDYLTINDNNDQNIKVSVNDSFVSWNKLGVYPIIFEAIDRSNNIETYETNINIIDTTKPTLVLTSNPKHIEVGSDLYEIDFYNYVVSLYDNETKQEDLEVIINHDIDVNRIGTYQIVYNVSDNSKNSVTQTLKIQVKDTTSPKIEQTGSLIADVFDDTFNVLDYFNIFDNYDLRENIKITVKTTYNIKKTGSYPLEITAEDTNKNKSYFNSYIEVLDLIKPEVYLIKDIVLEPFEYFDILDYVEILDNYDKKEELVYWLDDDSQKFSQIGNYNLNLYVSDSSKNVEKVLLEIIVIDKKEPIIKLSTNKVSTFINEILDLKSFIINVEDDVSIVTIDDVYINSNIDYSKRGKYYVEYKLFDESGNMKLEVLEVIVQDNTVFDVEVENLKLNSSDEHYDLLGLNIKSNYISYQIIKTDNFNNQGIHQVTYLFYDESGEVHTYYQLIEIKQKKELKNYLPSIVSLIGGMGILFYLLKKQKKVEMFE